MACLVAALLAAAFFAWLVALRATLVEYPGAWAALATALAGVVAAVVIETRARIADKWPRGWDRQNALAATTLLYTVALIPAAVLAWPLASHLPGSQGVHDLRLRGTPAPSSGQGDAVYLAEPPVLGPPPEDRPTADPQPLDRLVAGVPADRVEEVFIGPDAGRATCDPRGAPSVAHVRQLSGESTGAAARARRSAGVILASSPRRALARLGLVVNATALAASGTLKTRPVRSICLSRSRKSPRRRRPRGRSSRRSGPAGPSTCCTAAANAWLRRNQARMHRIAKRTARHATFAAKEADRLASYASTASSAAPR